MKDPGRRENSITTIPFGVWQQIWKIWKKLDASEIYPRRINAKKVLTTQKYDEFIFPLADGTSKLSGRDHEFREPTPRREPTVRREDFSRELHGEPGECQPAESTDDAEARANFWSIQGDFICRHHNEPRVQLYVLKEETLPIPLKYIDVARSTHTDLDVCFKKNVPTITGMPIRKDICHTLGKDSQSSPCCSRNLQSDMWSGRDWQRFKRLPDRVVHVQKNGRKLVKPLRIEKKRWWAKEKPKLDNARTLRRIYFIDPDEGEYKFLKHARKIGKTHGTSHAL